jgi:hypothetical protein
MLFLKLALGDFFRVPISASEWNVFPLPVLRGRAQHFRLNHVVEAQDRSRTNRRIPATAFAIFAAAR